MRLLAFAVYDEKASAFLPPFFMSTRGQAVRAFMDECRRPESAFAAHLEDYTLFGIGTYDQASGNLEGQIPQSILMGISLKESEAVNALTGR